MTAAGSCPRSTQIPARVGTTDRRKPSELASQSRSRSAQGIASTTSGRAKRPSAYRFSAECGQTDDRRQRLGPEAREKGQPLAIVDRQVVGSGMELDRKRDRGVVPDHRGQDVRQRQDPRPDRPGLPAKPAGGERQDRVLDVGGDHARGQPLGQLDRIIQPHHQVAGIERHSGDVGVEPVEHRDQLVAGQIGMGLDRQPDSQVLEARSEPLDAPRSSPRSGRSRGCRCGSGRGDRRRRRRA